MHENEKLKESNSNIRIPCRSSIAHAVAIGKAKANPDKAVVQAINSARVRLRRYYPP